MLNIKVPKRFSHSSVDELLSHVQHTRDRDEPIRLILPVSLHQGGILLSEASLIQFLITLRQRHGQFYISTYASPRDIKDQLDDLAGRAFGIAAFYLSDGLYINGGKLYKRRDLLEHATKYIESTDRGDYRNSTKGTGVNILMLSGAQKEYPRPLYSFNNPPIKDPNAIHREVLSILKTLGYPAKGHANVISMANPISRSLRELVENVDEHAIFCLHDRRIKRNLRSVLFRYQSIDKQTLAEAAKQGGPLTFFAGSTAIRSIPGSSKSATALFELSIIDSGIGLPGRWLNKAYDQISLQEQVQATIDCFKKGTTTKTNHSSAGYGLYRLQKIASKYRGLIEIRTGNVSIWKRFKPEDSLEQDVDWDTQECALSLVSGTRISLILPVENE